MQQPTVLDYLNVYRTKGGVIVKLLSLRFQFHRFELKCSVQATRVLDSDVLSVFAQLLRSLNPVTLVFCPQSGISKLCFEKTVFPSRILG